MVRYLLAAALLGALSLAGVVYTQGRAITRLETDLQSARGRLAECSGRVQNIEEDRESDASVLDPGFTVPDRWLRQD